MTEHKKSEHSDSLHGIEPQEASSQERRRGMTPQEAGRLGGKAPHRCRGFACQQHDKKEENS